MDVNVKGLEPEVVERLGEQASVEGLSQQEWIRRVLRNTAGRLSPAELMAQRASLSPMGTGDFEKIRVEATRRHRAGVEHLGASQRRR